MNVVKAGSNSWKSGRALVIVAGLLIASSAIRFGTNTGFAFAQQNSLADIDTNQVTELPNCEAPPDIAIVLAALQEREANIEKKELLLLEKEAALDVAEEKIRENLVALEQAEEELAGTMALANKAAEGDLTTLTTIYENMKPKEASLLFEEMAVDFAAGFLGRMRPDVAASIMAGLSAQKAYSISAILAGRNANVPTE